jgi:MFS family permease
MVTSEQVDVVLDKTTGAENSHPTVQLEDKTLAGIIYAESPPKKKRVVIALQQAGTAAVEKPKHKIVKIHRCFGVIVFITMAVNFDSGAVPAILDTMRRVFNMQPIELGMLGGLQYLGLTIMCPIAGHLLQTYGKRRVLSTCLLLNTVCCLGFALSFWKSILLLCRVGIGMTQAIIVVYAPVWVDDFAGEGQAATWMAILQASMPLGVMIGYSTAGFMVNSGWSWRVVILIQVVLLLPPTIGSFFVPKKYLENDYRSKTKDDDDLQTDRSPTSVADGRELYQISIDGGNSSSTSGVAETQRGELPTSSHLKMLSTENPASPKTGFRTLNSTTDTETTDTDTHDTDTHDTNVPQQQNQPIKNTAENQPSRPSSVRAAAPAGASFWSNIITLMSSGVFVCATLGLSCLYFVVTGVQFWATEFLLEVVQAPYATVLGAFAGTSASAPVLGVVLGGIVVDKLGGYQGSLGAKRTTRFCALFACLATTSALFASMATTFTAVLTLVWLVLFFGGAIVPGATGLVLASVPHELRPLSSAMSIFVFNIFGYMAGTMVPALYMVRCPLFPPPLHSPV